MMISISELKKDYATGRCEPESYLHALQKKIKESESDAIWTYVLSVDEINKFLSDANKNGSLYGVPFAIKDNIDLEGVPTTAGCPDYLYTPSVSSTAVRALLDEGAIPMGKTNMDQFATGLVGTRSPFGACQHAWHPKAISGGSSSGSAVAVAKGLCAFSLGTDTAGSGRVPASLNGIVGYKPTPGLVSMTGVVPACRSLDTISVFTAEIEDLEEILKPLVTKDDADPLQRIELESGREGPLKFATMKEEDLKWVGRGNYDLSFGMALDSLRAQGYQIEEVDLSVFSEVALMLYEGPWVAERYEAVGEFLEGKPDSADPTVSKIIGGGASIPAKEVFANRVLLEERKKKALKLFSDYHGLLLPTIGGWFTRDDVAEDPVGVNSSLGLYTNFANLLELSACAFPISNPKSPDDPQLGLTLFGPGGEDETTLRRSSVLREALEWMPVAVCGAHLTDFPLNHQLRERGAVLLKTTRTVPEYKMVAINEMKPALLRQKDGGVAIEVEIWGLPKKNWGSFLGEIPSPLGLGTVLLEGGESVKGFIGESDLVQGEDISSFGGWRAFKNQSN